MNRSRRRPATICQPPTHLAPPKLSGVPVKGNHPICEVAISTPSITLVETPQGLDRLLRALQSVDRLAFDTEFHAENRFIPNLMLMQLYLPDGTAYLADAVKLDLTPLARLLVTKRLTIHGGKNDLAILHHMTGAVPKEIFDTQRMAALVGLGFPTGLKDLAKATVGRSVDKGPTLTDWKHRPLSQEQIRYAAEDAAVLFPIEEHLTQLIEAAGHLALIGPVNAELTEEAAQGTLDPTPWLSWPVAPKLTPVQASTLWALHAWRMEQANTKNRPVHYILTDGLALDLARRRPLTIDAIRENRRVPHALVHKHGDVLVQLINNAEATLDEAPRAPTQAQARTIRAIGLWAEAHQVQTGLAANLLFPKHVARQIVLHGTEEVSSWRRDIIAQPLGLFLEGKQAVTIARGDVGIVPVATNR